MDIDSKGTEGGSESVETTGINEESIEVEEQGEREDEEIEIETGIEEALEVEGQGGTKGCGRTIGAVAGIGGTMKVEGGLVEIE